MEIFPFLPKQETRINQHGSVNAFICPVALLDDTTSVVCIRLQPGGMVGHHPTSRDQLLLVISGQGEVCGDIEQYSPIEAGQCVLWRKGEKHTTRSATGLTAVVVEGTLKRLMRPDLA